MQVHTLIIQLKDATAHQIPRFIAGRAAVLLKAEYLDDARTRTWIDPVQTREIGPAAMLVQITTPNKVATDQVLAAVNQAVAEYLPDLRSYNFETILFSSIPCMNQDQ